jgi:hypothetical protein
MLRAASRKQGVDAYYSHSLHFSVQKAPLMSYTLILTPLLPASHRFSPSACRHLLMQPGTHALLLFHTHGPKHSAHPPQAMA